MTVRPSQSSARPPGRYAPPSECRRRRRFPHPTQPPRVLTGRPPCPTQSVRGRRRPRGSPGRRAALQRRSRADRWLRRRLAPCRTNRRSNESGWPRACPRGPEHRHRCRRTAPDRRAGSPAAARDSARRPVPHAALDQDAPAPSRRVRCPDRPGRGSRPARSQSPMRSPQDGACRSW